MFGCVHLPGFPVEAALREDPSWRDHPCAIVVDSGHSGNSEAILWAVNHTARQQGIAPGTPVVRAQLRCPTLRLLDRHPENERQLTERLASIAEAMSPVFEITTPDTLIVDLNGCPKPEHWRPTMAGLRLNLANTPDLARFAALAGLPFSPQPVHPSDLDELPITLLRDISDPAPEKLLSLSFMWGLRTLGDLRGLPAPDLAERTNPETLRIHEILNGRCQRLLRQHRRETLFVQNIHFDHSIENMESLVFQIHMILNTLCARMKSSHLAVTSIYIKLLIETNGSIEKTIQLPEPKMAPESLLPVIHTALENLRISGGVKALELELKPVRPVATQHEWLGRQLRQPGRWPDTLARLEALLGHDRVGIARPCPGHRPDDFKVFSLSRVPGGSNDRRPDCGFPLRRFRPPLEVAVAAIGGGLDQRPQALLTGPYAGPIRRCHGPFPMSGDWWCPRGAWRRIEWDVEMESQHLLRLASLPPDRWLVEGSY